MLKKAFLLLKEKTLLGFTTNFLVLLGVIATGILLFFFVYLPKSTRHGETVTVPNLEGMPFADMDDFLGKRGFRYEVADSGYSPLYPPLSVLQQYPRAGTRVKENRKIYLTVKAKMPQVVKMPDLIDGTLKNAELVLQSYGLRRGEITYKPDLAVNAILQQLFEGERIAPGEPVPKGSFIDLVVGDGLGNQSFPAPNFRGLELEEATFSIRGSGLNVGMVMVEVIDSPEEHESLLNLSEGLEDEELMIFGSGRVIRQSPEPGTEIRLGDQVDLWLMSLDSRDSLGITERWERYRRMNRESAQIDGIQ